MLSVWLGQDASFDLRNYHLYNPWAFLGGHRLIDFAAAQLQSFFNPVIDIPYYLASMYLPGKAAAFMMGFVHGLTIIPLYGISRLYLAPRWAALVGIVGCLSPIFLYQLGGVMGDDTTALLALLAVWVYLRAWSRLGDGSPQALRVCIISGVIMGAAVGLKLTNGPYAVALCTLPWLVVTSWRRRALLCVCCAGGVLLGIALFAGFWYWDMWLRFGNPLFPQFNSLFKSELAGEAWQMDARWGPVGAVQFVLWPYLCALRPSLFNEIRMVSLTIPLAYTLMLMFGAERALTWWRRAKPQRGQPAPQTADLRERAVMVFVAISYLVWLKVFSIGRYAVVIELLAPLVAVLAWRAIFGAERAMAVLIAVLGVSCLISVIDLKTWGKAAWANRNFAVDIPALPAPSQSIVAYVGGEPQAWMTPFFPADIEFISLGGFYPSSAGHRALVRQKMGGKAYRYAAFPQTKRRELEGRHAWNLHTPWTQFLRSSGLFATPEACRRVASLTSKFFELDTSGEIQIPLGKPPICELVVAALPSSDALASSSGPAGTAFEALGYFGLTLVESDCTTHDARIGSENFPYRLCPIRPSDASTALTRSNEDE